jgi:hypothetical protein
MHLLLVVEELAALDKVLIVLADSSVALAEVVAEVVKLPLEQL